MLKAGAISLSILFLASLGFGQDTRFDASINGGEAFTNTITGNGIKQGATAGAEIFGSFRYHFKPKHSMLFTYGRTRNSQTYLANNNFHVVNSISEISGTYMFSPWPDRKWEPFFVAGGGALIFKPDTTWVFFPDLPNNVPDRVQVNLGASSQTEIAFHYGVGVDYRVPRTTRISLRIQYRGFLYKAPDFHVEPNSGSTVSFFTGGRQHMAIPSIGLLYRF